MLNTLESDVATSIAILDRLPASERSSWLARLSRGNYNFILGQGLAGVPATSKKASEIGEKIEDAIDHRFPIRIESIPGEKEHFQAHLSLSDGSNLTIDVTPTGVMRLASWLPYVLAAQLVLLVFFTWCAVRLAITPLASLARAVNEFDPNDQGPRLKEAGPTEVVFAARVFNSMRERIAQHLEERVQILAAISHDLQTPLTRMRLRTELSEETLEKTKLVQDIGEIERLVKEGLAYARSAHGTIEKQTRLDVGSFIESLAYDYQDVGQPVTVAKLNKVTLTTRPHALRRILSNLVDNSLKFAGSAEITVTLGEDQRVVIGVHDSGPGIPDEQLHLVLQPFFRLEQSRNRGTGGTGLGLAICHQLAAAIGASLRLSNRTGGGLSAELIF
jgi:signal transduction histidine kinase